LILVKTDADKKLAPKPSITSSAGPLTVTTYFVSDIHVFEPGKTATKNMFIEIKNDGKGTGKITGMSINGYGVPDLVSGVIRFIPLLIENDTRKVALTSCSPDPKVLSVGEDPVTVVCSLAPQDATVVSGSYRTVPVIIDVDYTYTQTHSTTVGIKKESIPEGVTDIEQIIELDTTFKPLPYYCPNVNVPGGGSQPLKIYDTAILTQAKACDQIRSEPECTSQSNCIWTSPFGKRPGVCSTK